MLSSRISLAVAIPQTFLDGRVDPARLRRFLVRAEALGFSGAWVVEQVIGTVASLGPIECLTYAAAVTERMRLGVAVLLTALRSPIHTAKSLASLDQLSGGRLDVGVGLGGQPAIYPAFGLTAERRAARFGEGIRVIKQLWTESRVTFTGDFYRLDGVVMEPKPLQRPHPPLWFGANHPNAIRRAVELGDAFMGAGSASTSAFAEHVAVLRRHLETARRDPATFPVAKRVYVAIDADRARAGRRLTEWFGAFYRRPELAPEVAVWGSVDEVADGLRAVAAAGAGMLMLNPVFDEEEQLERFADDLAPRLR
jgi:probable F420-dependent oxidoreductase